MFEPDDPFDINVLMKPGLLFHVRAGIRVAIRRSPPLFCAIIAVILFQDSPTAFVVSLAEAVYASRPSVGAVFPYACIAFLLAWWASARLSLGLNGWIRHLPISNAAHRRALILALIVAQLPLIVMLTLLGLIAHGLGLAASIPATRWVLVLIASAMANLPVNRRLLVAGLGVAAAALALPGTWHMAFSVPLFLVIDRIAGPIGLSRRNRHWHTASSLVSWRIASRALGLRVIPALGLGIIAQGAGWLFIFNNGLRGSSADGAARFFGSMASVLCLVSLAKTLAVRRPVWPLARSFPWSAVRRVIEDGVFLALHTLPFLLLTASQSGVSMLQVCSLVPFLSIRATEYMKRIPGGQAAAFVFLAEGIVAASCLTMLPWTAFLWLAGAIPALHAARRAELCQKATIWMELHHAGAGDSSLWSRS